MNDRELLEAAAKAAGHAFKWGKEWHDKGAPYVEDRAWNPLTDDGDAFRLAVKLRFMVSIDARNVGHVILVYPANHEFVAIEEQMGRDHYAATRRAIVRAAAASPAKPLT